MILFGQSFLAQFDSNFILSIEGAKRSGKDLLAMEIAEWYLRRGYGLYTNQRCVWNDPLYKGHFDENDKFVLDKQEVDGKEFRVPLVRKKIFIFSEGGAFLRETSYFGNINRYVGKMKSRIIISSTQVAHANLAVFRCENVINFRTYLGVNGGIFVWILETGRRPQWGTFVFIPTQGYGIYDTEDFAENTNYALRAIEDEIEITQRRYGRDGIQTVGFTEETIDMGAQLEIARSIERSALSLRHKR